ncbi:MAG: VWA domain-containing protein [Clostridiales Family XIII bacterium]|jgi:uncharacterized protein with von Willebrand factor type A (vWA) domain|nr:VWA domain-containing protein [Clostridiales Family XIII bacterium]
MFLAFFYLLKARGLRPSIHQWMTLMDALSRGMGGASLTGFYALCRAVLLTNEADFDRFDEAFLEFFRDVALGEDIPPEFLDWIAESPRVRDLDDRDEIWDSLVSYKELLKRLEERLLEQKERHDGGTYWVGTGGASTQGHGGFHEQGIRVGGEGRHGNALAVAAAHRYRDFREDEVLGVRQFQTALRHLRQYSSRDTAARTELDLPGTIDGTAANAGTLKLVYERPRVNTVKLLVLFDCAGSMEPYARLANRLFQAVSRANHFKDTRFYYFHNSVYDKLYRTAECITGDWVDSDYVLRLLDGEYRLVIVGDANMAPYELFMKSGIAVRGIYSGEPSIDRLRRFRRRFGHAVWLNPIPRARWSSQRGHETIAAIGDIFPMHELTLGGLDKAIRELLTRPAQM